MTNELPELNDPTPVSGELESVGYRPPRLRVTATYDTAGTSLPTSLDVEVHDDDVLDEAVIVRVVDGVVAVLTRLSTPPSPPVTTGTWTSGSDAHVTGIRYRNGDGAAA